MAQLCESFSELIARVRQGDEQAAADLVRRYQADLRVIARVRLTDPRLRRVLDSMDICQSIMANFFVRVAAGQFELETPEQLMKLLSTMVRNKVTDRARWSHRDRRDARRVSATRADEVPLAGRTETPSQIVSQRELMQVLRDQLGDQDRQMAEQRVQGKSWRQIADQLGSTPEAVRKRYSRAVDQAVSALGLDELNDE